MATLPMAGTRTVSRTAPETTTDFAKVLRAAGPKLLTERFGRFLGIL